MPGMTLCGEALTFAHDAQLLGFCLDNPDEPAGDDFETRCRNKLLGGAWIDPQVGYLTQEDVDAMNGVVEAASDTDDEEESYDADDEVRGIRASFCAMSSREQNRFIAKMKLRICSLIGASYFDWEPSDEFILEIIEDETPEDAIFEMARAAYLAAPVPPEDNPSDDKEPDEDEGADKIRIGLYSGERGLPNIGYRFSNRGLWLAERDRRKGPRALRNRRRSYRDDNSESHCPKYGRQDYRHQAPRIEAKYERRFAAYEAMMEAYFREMDCWEPADDEVRNETNFTEAEMVALDEQFGFSDSYWDYVDYMDREMCRKMDEMARDFGYPIDDPCDIAGTRGYMPGDFERRGYYGPNRFDGYLGFGLYVDDYDPMDDYVDYYDERDRYDEPCDCDDCRAEREHQRLIDRFGDWYDDMDFFDDFCGPTEADLDAMQIGQSNSKWGPNRLLKLMERHAAFA